MLFNIFISDLDDGIKCTLMNFVDDTKLSGEVDTSEGRATLQEDLDKLEEWSNKNLMKFHKDKYVRRYDTGQLYSVFALTQNVTLLFLFLSIFLQNRSESSLNVKKRHFNLWELNY
ncbi:cAMP-dependent protein kinase inhibitor alpha [Grus japonensis]|uniref:cAMP-dependent protein kinase inhibitor alpha n=1 Tax=Grus japonensis TaxID=30415 RepID=A0ABC9WGM5_GRUJA